MIRVSPLAAVLAAALACFAASADRPEYAWGKTFEVEQLADMVLDGDGNLYVALNEYIDLTPDSLPDAVTYHDNRIGRLHKYAPDGTLLWDKVVAGPRAVIQDLQFGLDGYLYVSGRMQGDCVFKPGEEAVALSAIVDQYINGFPPIQYTGPGTDDFIVRLDEEAAWGGSILVGDTHMEWDWEQADQPVQVPPTLVFHDRREGADIDFAIFPDGSMIIAYPAHREILPSEARSFLRREGLDPITLDFRQRSAKGFFIRTHMDMDMLELLPIGLGSHGGFSADGSKLAVLPDGNFLFYGHNMGLQPDAPLRDYPVTRFGCQIFLTMTQGFEVVRVGSYNGAFIEYLPHRRITIGGATPHFGLDSLGRGYAIGGFLREGATLDWSDENLQPPPEYEGESYTPRYNALIRFDAEGGLIDIRELPGLRLESTGRGYGHRLWRERAPMPVNGAGDLYLPYSIRHNTNSGFRFPYAPLRSIPVDCGGADGCDTMLFKFDEDLREDWHVSFTAVHNNAGASIYHDYLVVPEPSGAVYFASEFYEGPALDLDPTEGEDWVDVPPPLPETALPVTYTKTLFFLTKLNDIAEPDVRSIVRVGTNPTKGPLVEFVVTYDEPVTGVDIDDFALTATGGVTGASIVSVSGSDAVWTVTVDVGTGEGTLRLDAVDDDSIKSATDEPLGGPGVDNGAYNEGEAYTLDYTGPVAVITNIGPDYTIIPETQVVVTFDEPVTGLDASDFLVTNGVVTGVTGSGAEYIVTIEITTPGDATVALIGGGAGDTAGNANGASSPLTVRFIDLNGDPTIPAAAWWALGLMAAALAAMGWRYRRAAFLPLALMACFTASADRPEYAWSKTFDGLALAQFEVDANGNSYVALVDEADAQGQPSPVTVQKYDPDGALLWERLIVGTDVEADVRGLAVAADGSVFVAGAYSPYGVFDGFVLFDPDDKAITVRAIEPPQGSDLMGGSDYFLVKLDGDGVLAWLAVAGTDAHTGNQIRQNVYLGIQLLPTADGGVAFLGIFPGVLDAEVVVRRPSLDDVTSSQTVGGSCLIRFGSGGAPLWFRHFIQEFDQQPWALGMSHDAAGNLVVHGTYHGVDFDPGEEVARLRYLYGPLRNQGSPTEFILRLTPGGEFLNVRVRSTEYPDVAYTYGRDDAGIEYFLASFAKQPDSPFVLMDDENRYNESVYPGLDAVNNGGGAMPLALQRFDAAGEPIGTAPLQNLPVVDGPVDASVMAPLLPSPRQRHTPVTGAGDLFWKYHGPYSVLDSGEYRPIPDTTTSAELVKLDGAMRVQWRVEFGRSGGLDTIGGVIRIDPDGSVFTAHETKENSLDLDPTEGTDIHTVEVPETTFSYITKLHDIIEPDVTSIIRSGTNPTKGPLVDFTVTYDEPVTGVDTDDFALTATGAVAGAAIVSVSGADAVWTVTVDVGTGEGTLRLDAVDDDSIKSATDEPLGGPGLDNGAYTEGEAYTLDYTGPVAVLTNIGPDYTIIPETQVVVTFNEPVTGVDASDFLVTNGVVTDVTGSGTNYIVTIEIAAPGDATIELIGGGAGDIAGNANGASAPLNVTFIDLNGDPSIPAAAWWTLGLMAAALAAMGWRYRRAAFLSLALMACAPAAYGDYPLLEWVRHHGEFVSSTVSDDDGNIYITGGIRVENNTGFGGIMRDMFVAKYDSDGALIWETRMEQGGPIDDEWGVPGVLSRVWGYHIALGTDGSVYAAGVLGGRVTAEVAGEPFEYLHRWHLDTIPVLWRLTPDGDIEWMRTVRPGSFFQRGSLGTDSGQPVLTAAAPDGGAYFVGFLKVVGPVYVRPGPDSGTPFASIARTQPNPNVPLTPFVLRLDANGETTWGHVLEYEVCSDRGGDAPVGIAVSPEGDICIVGRFAGKADFDPAADSEAMLESQPIDDPWSTDFDRQGFAWILDADGELVQACAFGGPDTGGPEGLQACDAAYLGAGRWGVSAALNTENAEAAFTNGTIVPIAGLPQDTPFTHAVLVIHQDGTLDGVAPMAKAASLPHNDIHERPSFGGHLAYGEPARTYYTSDIAAQPPGKWPGTPNGNFNSVQGYDGGVLDWVLCIDGRYTAMWDLAAAPQNRFALAGELGAVYRTEPIDADFDPYGPGMPSTQEGGYIAVYTDVATLDVRTTAPSGAAATPAQTAQFAVEFDEAAFNVAPEDFVLTADGVSGASITGLAGSGTSYVVTVDTGVGDGTLRLDVLDRDTIFADDGVPLGGAGLGNGAFEDGAPLTVDRTAPTVTITNIGPDYTIIPETQVVVTFDEPVTGLDAGDFLVTNGVVTDVTGSGADYIVTIEITAPGDATIALIGGGAGDIAGNANGASAPLTVQFIDLNGDPSIPTAAWWALGLTAAALAAMGWRYRRA